jgi:hypothetical protein
MFRHDKSAVPRTPAATARTGGFLLPWSSTLVRARVSRGPHTGCVNLAVVRHRVAEVGTTPRQTSSRPTHWGRILAAQYRGADQATDPKYSPQDRFLVYCFRGGKRSRLWRTACALGLSRVLPAGGKRTVDGFARPRSAAACTVLGAKRPDRSASRVCHSCPAGHQPRTSGLASHRGVTAWRSPVGHPPKLSIRCCSTNCAASTQDDRLGESESESRVLQLPSPCTRHRHCPVVTSSANGRAIKL